MISGKELKIPAGSSTALSAPTVKPSLKEGLSPCSNTASKKIVNTINKLINTERKEVNLKAVSVRGSDIGKVRSYLRLISIKLTAKTTAQNICPFYV